MVRTQGNTLVKRTSHHSVRLRKAARVDQSSKTRLKSQVAATPGQAAITEAVALLAVPHREAEAVTVAEAVARASEEEEVAAAEVKEEDVVAVAGTEASTPTLVKVTRAMAAWSTRTVMRYATGATWCIDGRNGCIVWWKSTTGSNSGDSPLINAEVF